MKISQRLRLAPAARPVKRRRTVDQAGRRAAEALALARL